METSIGEDIEQKPQLQASWTLELHPWLLKSLWELQAQLLRKKTDPECGLPSAAMNTGLSLEHGS